MFTHLQKLGWEPDTAFLRDTLRSLMDMLMEIEVSEAIEAGYYERNGKRVAYRNGYRARTWKTRFGTVALSIPKLRRGSYYPSFLEAQCVEDGLLNLIRHAFVFGASVEQVEALLFDLGLTWASSSAIADLTENLSNRVYRQRNRPIWRDYPTLWLETVRFETDEGRRYTAAIAIGIDFDGYQDVLDFEIGVDDSTSWRAFLDRLAARGLGPLDRVISDTYAGLRIVLDDIFPGADWQYSGLRWIQTVLDHVPEAERDAVIDAISTAFINGAGTQQLEQLIESLRVRWPQASLMLQPGADYLPMDAVLTLETLGRIKQVMAGRAVAIGTLQPLVIPDHYMAVHLYDSRLVHHKSTQERL